MNGFMWGEDLPANRKPKYTYIIGGHIRLLSHAYRLSRWCSSVIKNHGCKAFAVTTDALKKAKQQGLDRLPRRIRLNGIFIAFGIQN